MEVLLTKENGNIGSIIIMESKPSLIWNFPQNRLVSSTKTKPKQNKQLDQKNKKTKKADDS